VSPLWPKQQGFKDELAFVPSDGKEAVAIKLWEKKENAEAYQRGAYPEALKALANVVEGTPQVQASNSTWHNIAARVSGSWLNATPVWLGWGKAAPAIAG
jgi:hypothetical protein